MSTSEEQMRQAEDLREADIFLAIAHFFHHGDHFVPSDFPRARHYYDLAIGAGSVEALAGLASLLLKGSTGVQRDPFRAMQLCEQAITQGGVQSVSDLFPDFGKVADELLEDSFYARILYDNVKSAVDDYVFISRLRTLLSRTLPRASSSTVQAGGDRSTIFRPNSLELTYTAEVAAGCPYETATSLGRGREYDAFGKNRSKHFRRTRYREYMLRKSVQCGDTDAVYERACLLITNEFSDTVRGTKLLEQAVSAGHTEAMYMLGHVYCNGVAGAPKDPIRAKMLFEKSFKGGNVNAMYELGRLLLFGAHGVPRDTRRAKNLLDYAVAAGNPDAMNDLGVLLRDGDDQVPRNSQRAIKLPLMAGRKSNFLALNNLGVLFRDGTDGVPRNYVLAKQCFDVAVRSGNFDATLNLSRLLLEGGAGVRRDINRAGQLYEKAVSTWTEESLRLYFHLSLQGILGMWTNREVVKNLLSDIFLGTLHISTRKCAYARLGSSCKISSYNEDQAVKIPQRNLYMSAGCRMRGSFSRNLWSFLRLSRTNIMLMALMGGVKYMYIEPPDILAMIFLVFCLLQCGLQSFK